MYSPHPISDLKHHYRWYHVPELGSLGYSFSTSMNISTWFILLRSIISHTYHTFEWKGTTRDVELGFGVNLSLRFFIVHGNKRTVSRYLNAVAAWGNVAQILVVSAGNMGLPRWSRFVNRRFSYVTRGWSIIVIVRAGEWWIVMDFVMFLLDSF